MRNANAIEYAYYPDGDADPQSRRTRIGLVCEAGEWRRLGGNKLSPEEFEDIRNNITSGRGELQRIVGNGSRNRVNGRGDLVSPNIRPDRLRRAA